MSYIRPGSNPEALYIWGSDRGRVSICHNVRRPLASKTNELFEVPCHVFEGLCRKWAKAFDERATYRGATAERVHVLLHTGKPVPKKHNPFRSKAKTEFLIKFSYGGHFFHMWTVTWEYVVADVAARDRV